MTARASTLGRLARPIPVSTFPFVTTIDVEDAPFAPDEPSPCLPTARSSYALARPVAAGSWSTSRGARRSIRSSASTAGREPPATLVFLGCASPVWNAQLALTVDEGETLLAQIGTSESHDGRLVARVELQ